MPAIDKRTESAVHELAEFFSTAEGSGSPCLSITNLCDDATPREVHILFSGCLGYVKSYLAWDSKERRLWGIVHFTTEEQAMRAAESRKGTTWNGTRAIRIDLGMPQFMTDRGVELTIVQRDRVPGGDASLAVKQKCELMTPAAQKAYRQLAAAIKSRRAEDLREAIAQGKDAGLDESELRAAKDTLSLVNVKVCATTAASCEARAYAVMKKALGADVPAPGKAKEADIEALRHAQRVGQEASRICALAGLLRGERRMRALAREVAERLEMVEAGRT